MTKFNLSRPALAAIIFQPFFFLWPVAMAAGLLGLTGSLFVVGLSAAGLWLLFVASLPFFARPYPLLIKRRKKIGVSLAAILTVVPALIYLRQVCINLGQLKKALHRKRA